MTSASRDEIDGLKRIGRIVGLTLREMTKALRPGMTTKELDEIGRAYMQAQGARSAPILAYHFPGNTCISINEEAAHGIPGNRVIQPGDLVNIDVSAEMDGLFADTGASVPVPPVTAEIENLCNCTRAALKKAIEAAVDGNPLNAIGKAVEGEASRCGYNIIAALNGHGVGHSLHEEPHYIPNYYNPRDRRILKEGMVIAIEPFLTPGNGQVLNGSDGWTISTADGSRLAQYEHSIIITKGKPIILTAV